MPGSATVNCAWLWNKQHLFLLISSLSVSKFVSVNLSLLHSASSNLMSLADRLLSTLHLYPLHTPLED